MIKIPPKIFPHVRTPFDCRIFFMRYAVNLVFTF